MPCCGLIAFLLAQPVLLRQGIQRWLNGEAGFRQVLQVVRGAGQKSIAGLVLAELILLGAGATLTVIASQPGPALAQATLAPLGRICSLLGHETN